MLLSLFSGCGGLDLGFERAGFSIGLAYDIRPHSISSWNRNRSDGSHGHIADLSTICLKDIDRDYGERFIPHGVIGGPPCQSFSRANRHQSSIDPRHKLVKRFFLIALRFHRYRHPLDFILMENVPELAKAEDGKLLHREIERLERYGFKVHTLVLNAVSYSVPQNRKRLFVLAIPRSNPKMEYWSPPEEKAVKKNVGDVIRGLPQPTYFRRGLDLEAIPFHPNHWCMNPRSRRFFDGSLIQGYSSGRCFKTLSWDSPSFTASYGHREVHVHPDGHRRLSVLEAMRLQGFPDDYILDGTLSAQIDQVSEAVPPPFAEAIALSIRSNFSNSMPCVSLVTLIRPLGFPN